MKVKAAIAIEKGKSLIIDHVDLEGPKKGQRYKSVLFGAPKYQNAGTQAS